MVSSSMFMLSSIIKHILITFWKQFLKMTIHKGKPAPNPDREENLAKNLNRGSSCKWGGCGLPARIRKSCDISRGPCSSPRSAHLLFAGLYGSLHVPTGIDDIVDTVQ